MSYVLITGASSGIGKEFAKSFASKGFDLLLVARNQEKLEKLKEEILKDNKLNVECFACDLAKEAGPKEVYEYTKTNNIMVNVLINNAGYGDFGEFINGDINVYQNMVNLNCKALMSLTYYFALEMKNNGYGHIVNIASVASFMPGPYMDVYYATKAFVSSFSLALREELKDDNVKVTVICPGPVNTAFWQRAGVEMSDLKRKLLARSPNQVAATGMKAIKENKALVIDGPINNLAINLSKLVPNSLLTKIVGKLQKKLTKR